MKTLLAQVLRILTRDIRALIVIALIATSILLNYIEPSPEDRGEYSSPQLVNIVQCIGWKEASSSVNQRLYVLNGDDTATLNMAVDGTPSTLNPVSRQSVAIESAKAVQVVAEGEGANSMTSMVVVRSKGNETTGMASDNCHAPGDDWWFSGVRTLAGYSARLLLANPDSADAIIAVTAYNAEGELQIGRFRRIVVPAHKVKLVDLTQATPGEGAVSIHLRAIEGRVTPSLQAESLKGAKRYGRTFISPIAAPTTTPVIAGIRSTMQKPQLIVLSPNADAIITVKIHRADGSFTMAGADSLLITKEQTRVLSLDEALSASDAAIEIVSDQPVVAAVRGFIKVGSGIDYEVQSAQPAISSHVVTLMPDGVTKTAFYAFSTSDATVAVTATRQGKTLWQHDYQIVAGGFAPFVIKEALQSKTILTFTTTSAGVYLSQAMTAPAGKNAQVSVLGLVDPSSQMVAGVRLHLLIS